MFCIFIDIFICKFLYSYLSNLYLRILIFYYCVAVLVFNMFVLAICLPKLIVGGCHINIQMWMQRSVSKYKKTWNQQHQKPHILEKDNDIFYHPLCYTKYGLIILSQYTSPDTNWLCISLPLISFYCGTLNKRASLPKIRVRALMKGGAHGIL